jgi:hypothetical protein
MRPKLHVQYVKGVGYICHNHVWTLTELAEYRKMFFPTHDYRFSTSKQEEGKRIVQGSIGYSADQVL